MSKIHVRCPQFPAAFQGRNFPVGVMNMEVLVDGFGNPTVMVFLRGEEDYAMPSDYCPFCGANLRAEAATLPSSAKASAASWGRA